MSGTVLVSQALVHPSNLRPFGNDVAERDEDRVIKIKKANERGERLDSADFAKVIFGAPNAVEKNYRVPDFFTAFGYYVVSDAVVSVLRQFDLGQAQLFPVEVFKKDRQTPIGKEWFCINFGNSRSLVVLEQSKGIRPGPQGRYNLTARLDDDEIAVSAAALQPPDIWVDPQFWRAFFLSEALGKALRKANVHQGFFLKKCRVLDA